MTVRVLTGDCRDLLPTLPADSVHCVITSPPYFGLRDYGTGVWEGGAADCQHSVGGQVQDSKAPGAIVGGVRPGVDASRCRLCGARRVDRQIGLEPTPAEFVQAMVEVFREVRRVLRPDGTLWLNLGDSYSTHAAGKVADPMAKSTLAGVRTQEVGNEASRASGRHLKVPSLPEKNLIGIPWRVAFALQADGWYLRQDIIWSKPNPMPESVEDRCTKAHEYLFLLTKRPRYYFDALAIAEKAVTDDRPRSTWQERKATEPIRRGDPSSSGHVTTTATLASGKGRNRRSVWTIATAPYKEAHFATFPPALVEPCILAGCPKGGQVLDPFGGAGTTGVVAQRLGRDALLLELNPAYAAMAETRIKADATRKARQAKAAPKPDKRQGVLV